MVGIRNDLDSMNPYLSVQSQARDITYQIFASLMEEQADFGQGPPTFRPQLATAWEKSPDGLQITFHLRPDAVWTDGELITAEDVRFSWKAATDPDVAWLGSDAKSEIKDVAVLDPHTVLVRYARDYPYQLMDMNDGVIIPAHIWSKVPFKDWRTSGLDREPVSSGPFRLTKWVRNQSIEMVRNDHFYQSGYPLLDRVVYRIMSDSSRGFEAFLQGELDFWDQVRPIDLPRLESNPAVQLQSYQDRYFCFIGWNTRRPLFAAPEVRLALTLGINRRRIVEDL
ncbi:MAG: ABC transporter substrate-binding protein, partial [Acidobacteriota bacterium]